MGGRRHGLIRSPWFPAHGRQEDAGMKVALAFPGCHRRAGVERVMFECARYLALRGHDVHVLANEWETDPSVRITYHRVELPKAPWVFQASAYFRRCGDLVDRGNYDVLNTHGCICPTGGVQWVQ